MSTFHFLSQHFLSHAHHVVTHWQRLVPSTGDSGGVGGVAIICGTGGGVDSASWWGLGGGICEEPEISAPFARYLFTAMILIFDKARATWQLKQKCLYL